jgi:GT2 family glycosyltransferase
VQLKKTSPSVSVVICCHTEARWELLMKAIRSVPVGAGTELIVVVDHNQALFGRLSAEEVPARIVENMNERGPSGARNSGVKLAQGDVVAFLDDDASGRPGWLDVLLRAFEDPSVVVAGGSAWPLWEKSPATWHPESFYWVFGCSWLGLPTQAAPVRNVIAACMAIKRSALETLGGFRGPIYGEETELCIRAAALGLVVYLPECEVDHFVPSRRMSLRYFISRCWTEGRSKAGVSVLVGARPALSREVRHFPVMAREGLNSLSTFQFRRAGAVALGAATTTLGYMWGRGMLLSGSKHRALRDRSE